jgi:hypothetical protein
MKRGYAKLTNAEIVKISSLLQDVTNSDDDGICCFAEHWSDARVAEEVIPNYPGNGEDAVARLRLQLGFGRLRSGRRKGAPIRQPVSTVGVIPEIIASLTSRIEALERQMAVSAVGAD